MPAFATRFSLIGASGVLVNNLLLWLLVSGAGVGYLLGAVVAVQGSIVSNFWLLERYLPGERPGSAGQRFVRFLGLSNTVQLLGYPLLALCVSVFGLHYLVANLLTLGVLFAVRLVTSHRWVWSPGETRPVFA